MERMCKSVEEGEKICFRTTEVLGMSQSTVAKRGTGD